MKILIDDIKNHRAEWLEARKGKIGSSEIATVLGMNPYKSRLRLWAEFTGQAEPNNLEDNDAVWWGIKEEPLIGEFYERKTGVEVVPCNALYQHQSINWAVASPDFFIWEPDGENKEITSILEAKTGSIYSKATWETEVPESYYLQCNWQMGVTGIHNCVIAAKLSSTDFITHDLTFDADIFDGLLAAGENFIRDVERREPPTATALDAELLTRLNKGKPQPTEVDCFELVTEYNQLIELRAAANKTADELDKKIKELQAQLRQETNDAPIAKCGNYLIYVTPVTVKAHEVKESKRMQVKVKEVK